VPPTGPNDEVGKHPESGERQEVRHFRVSTVDDARVRLVAPLVHRHEGKERQAEERETGRESRGEIGLLRVPYLFESRIVN
jgi:hypothetical protein